MFNDSLSAEFKRLADENTRLRAALNQAAHELSEIKIDAGAALEQILDALRKDE